MRARHFLAVAAAAAAVIACEPPPITVTETPIRIRKEHTGHGKPVAEGDMVTIDYVLTLPDGRVVLDQKGYTFAVGVGSVIRGVDEAIVGMRENGMREFTCPPHKHWGRAGYGNVIPPATDLEIRLTLLSIESRALRRRGVVATAGPDGPEDDE